MRRSVRVAGMTVVGMMFLCAVGRAASEFKPEEHLPPGTKVFIEASFPGDFMEKIKKTRVWKVWRDPEVRKFFEKSLRMMEKNFERLREIDKEKTGLDLSEFMELLPPRRSVMALTWLDFEKSENSVSTFFVDFAGKGEQARKAADRILKEVKKRAEEKKIKAEFSQRTVAGTKVTRVVVTRKEKNHSFNLLELGAPTVHVVDEYGEPFPGLGETEKEIEVKEVVEFCFLGDWLLVSTGNDPSREEVKIDPLLAPKASLGQDEDFRRARKKLGSGIPFVYVRLGDLIEESVKAEREAKKKLTGPVDHRILKEEKPLDTKAILKAVGISSIRSLAYAQRIEEEDVSDHFYLGAPEPREGLIFALSGRSLPPTRLTRFAPKSAQFYTEACFDPAKVWNSIKNLVYTAADEEEKKDFDEGVKEIEKKVGATLPEVFDCFTGQAAMFFSAPEISAPVGRQGFILPLKDPEKLEAFLSKVREIPEVKEGLSFQEETYKGVKIVSIMFRNTTLPLMPSYAVVEKTLLVSENPFSLKKTLAALKSGGGSLADSEKFKSVESRAFPKGAFAGSYVDLSTLVERSYSLVISVLTLGLSSPLLRDELKEAGVDLNLLPSAKAVAGHLGIGYDFVRLEKEGLEYYGRSAFGGGVLGIYKAFLGAAVPFFINAGLREAVLTRYEEVSREHLKKIYEAVVIYKQTVGGGRYPTDLTALVRAGLVEEEILVAPADEKPSLAEDPETGEEIAVSYRLRPKGFSAKENAIVLYEREAWYGKGKRLIVLKRGRVLKVWSKEAFEKLLRVR